MTTTKKKNITTESLARMTQKEFLGLHKRLTTLEEKTGGIDRKVTSGFRMVLDELQHLKRGNDQVLIAVSAITGQKVLEFRERLERLERKVGIGR